FLKEGSKQTKAQVRTAAAKAENLAKRLAILIESNASLCFPISDTWDEDQRAALNRILAGLLLTDEYGKVFSSRVEKRLNKLSAVDFPGTSTITTEDAFNVLTQFKSRPDLFFANLRSFAMLAAKLGSASKALSRPNAQHADHRRFA